MSPLRTLVLILCVACASNQHAAQGTLTPESHEGAEGRDDSRGELPPPADDSAPEPDYSATAGR